MRFAHGRKLEDGHFALTARQRETNGSMLMKPSTYLCTGRQSYWRYVTAVLALGSALLAGCSTQLQAVRVVDPENIPREGAPYNLTFTQYDLVVTRRLVGCWKKLPNGENSKEGQITVAIDVAATRKETRDPKRDYVIDFAQLRSFFKTSDITIEYHANGALKSVNATVADQTGSFFSSLATNLGKVVTVAGGGLLALADPNQPMCKKEALDALAAIKQLKAEVDVAAQDSEALTVDIERLTKMAQAMGRAWSKEERAELKDRINRLYVAQKKLKDSSDALAAQLKKVTLVSDKVTWPQDGETRETVAPLAKPLTEEELLQWALKGAVTAETVKGNTGIWVNLIGTTAIGKTKPCTTAACADDSPVGLKYRMPVPGALLICSSATCSTVAQADIKLVEEAAVSQLGPIMTLPLKNYPFMDQTIAATFNEAGQPTKLGFKQTPNLEKALDTLGVMAGEVSKYRAANQPKSELDTIKDETALLKAKADLASAQAALAPPKFSAQADSVALLTADTSLLKAQVAKLEAEAALAKAMQQTEKP